MQKKSFIDSDFYIIRVCGPRFAASFFSLEEAKTSRAKRVVRYSSEGELLDVIPVSNQTSEIRISNDLLKCCFFEYDTGTIGLIDVKNKSVIHSDRSSDVGFFDFVNGELIFQDEKTGILTWLNPSIDRNNRPAEKIVKWSESGLVIVYLDTTTENTLLIRKSNGTEYRCKLADLKGFEPEVSISKDDNYLVITETNGGIVVFSLVTGMIIFEQRPPPNNFKWGMFVNESNDFFGITTDKSLDEKSSYCSFYKSSIDNINLEKMETCEYSHKWHVFRSGCSIVNSRGSLFTTA